MKVNVLGTWYTVTESDAAKDTMLSTCDGYCDKTTKKIVITKQTDDSDLGDWTWYRNKILRHEIIHAFLIESGLGENWEHKYGHDETYVDWIATQFPKLYRAFECCGCI